MFDQITQARNLASTILVTTIVMASLSTLSILVRIAAKFQTKAKLGLDDAFIIAAQLFAYTEAGMSIYASHVAKQLTNMMDPGYPKYEKWVVIAGIFYAPTVLCVSVSILLFYRRVFPIQSMQRCVTIFLVLNTLWAIENTLGSIFICSPVQLVWAPLTVLAVNMDKCMKYNLFFVSTLSIELALNAAVLVLPIRQCLKLQLKLRTRLMLIFVFILGGISLISGAIRIWKSWIPGSPVIDTANDVVWLTIHVNTALIAASLPTYRPFLRASTGFLSNSLRKIYGSGYNSKGSTGSSNIKESKGYSSTSDKISQKSLVGEDQIDMFPMHHQGRLTDLEFKTPYANVERATHTV